MVGSHEYFIPHGDRFAHDFGDGGVESRVPLGVQVVDVRVDAGVFSIRKGHIAR